jgi:hypothetical protein
VGFVHYRHCYFSRRDERMMDLDSSQEKFHFISFLDGWIK